MQSLHETQSVFVADSDVTRQRNEVDAGRSPSAAISMKATAQPNRQQQRIFTSTPKSKRKSQQRRSSNDVIGFYSLAKATTKRYICVGSAAAAAAVKKGQAGATFDVHLKALLLLFGLIIIGNRIINLTMAYITNGGGVQQFSEYVQAQLSTALAWSEEHQLRSKLSPVLCGLIVAVFGYAIVYLDSAVPGVSPPAPFSPRSKQRNRQKRSALQLNYLCALGAGIMVTVLMYVDF